MVSTYTDNLRITKQGDNDNPNTWGGVVNQQVIELLEEAVTGVATVDCTGSSNVDISSTTQSGSTDTARHAVLELTGVVGADIEVIVPSVEKIYIVKANYTGDFTITVKPTGGSGGIPFTSGKKALVYTNGVNIDEIKVADDEYSDITVSSSGDVWKVNPSLIGDKSDEPFVDEDYILFARYDGGSSSFTLYRDQAQNLVNLFAPTVPTGTISDFGGTVPPSGYLACDGSAVSRTTYSDLYSAVGNAWGDGDGLTTFNLPNLDRRATIGSGGTLTATIGNTVGSYGGEEEHTLTEAEMPKHTHDTPQGNSGFTGTLFLGTTNPIGTQDTESAGNDEAHNNMQPSAVVLKIIKT